MLCVCFLFGRGRGRVLVCLFCVSLKMVYSCFGLSLPSCFYVCCVVVAVCFFIIALLFDAGVVLLLFGLFCVAAFLFFSVRRVCVRVCFCLFPACVCCLGLCSLYNVC